MARPSIVFVADDFTGASDTLATLARSGLRTRLYTGFPETIPEDLDAVGIATELRAMAPDEAVKLMAGLAPRIAALRARINHFKICSTFDSAPGTGNIAAVADVLASELGTRWTAIVGGQPSLGRYCIFGTLFARASDGAVHRIDLHPVMRHHPITPMAEADLRRHLALQGWADIGLVVYRAYPAGAASLRDMLERRLDAGEKHTLFDVSSDADLATVGETLWEMSAPNALLCVGASSVAEGVLPKIRPQIAHPAPSRPVRCDGPVLVVSGSRSPATQAQIESARAYEKFSVAAAEFLPNAQAASRLLTTCAELLGQGRNVLVAVAPGRNEMLAGRDLSHAIAKFVSGLLERARPRTLVVAGGDTSSAVVQGLGVESLEFVQDIDCGVPLVRASGRGSINGLLLALKGGQMGQSDILDRLTT